MQYTKEEKKSSFSRAGVRRDCAVIISGPGVVIVVRHRREVFSNVLNEEEGVSFSFLWSDQTVIPFVFKRPLPSGRRPVHSTNKEPTRVIVIILTSTRMPCR